ncbi:MAG TPA: NAD(P)-dependent alcohol dehydrogenase [Candidatus Limnocylindrales bacterium]|jgi:NADPH:quinone reductase-like Zn-dependent oxidoreductase
MDATTSLSTSSVAAEPTRERTTSHATPGTMLAITFHRFGSSSVLERSEVAIPAPAPDQVLVRVRASSVNPVDWHGMRGEPMLVRMSAGWRRPKDPRLGADVAGVVETVGAEVTDLAVGDEVFGMGVGTFAEFVVISGKGVVRKPADISFEEAAAIPVAATTALQGLRDVGRLQAGQSVLVNGASGGVGSFAVQLARALGASEVVGVCSSRNVELVATLGADRVVDYTRQDFLKDGRRYDVVFDTAGSRSVRSMRQVVAPRGTLVICGGQPGRWLGPVSRWIAGSVLTRLGSQRLQAFLAHRDRDDLLYLRDLVEAGTLRPVIDRRYPLAEVPDAIAYLEAGHARGKVVITV